VTLDNTKKEMNVNNVLQDFTRIIRHRRNAWNVRVGNTKTKKVKQLAKNAQKESMSKAMLAMVVQQVLITTWKGRKGALIAQQERTMGMKPKQV
jgi:hypothetical protein